MKRFIKSLTRKTMSSSRIIPVKRTGKGALMSFLKQLHPVLSGHELKRFGPAGDGGYLVPDDLEGITACFSPGVSSISGFERDCADMGMQVFLADCSVDGPASEHALFHFIKKYLGSANHGDFITLDHWVNTSVPESESELILQIDIEGFEYEVFHSASDQTMNRFRIIVVEFHMIDQLWASSFFQTNSRVFEKLLQTHVCVHAHPNNNRPSVVLDGISLPPLMEFTFLRKDRVNVDADGNRFQTRYPHPLDADNTDKPSLTLPPHWFNRSHS